MPFSSLKIRAAWLVLTPGEPPIALRSQNGAELQSAFPSPSICSLGQRVRSIEPWILVDPPAICRSRIAWPRFCVDSSIDQASGFVIRAVFRDICLWCSSAADSSPRTKAESLACRCGRSRVPR